MSGNELKALIIKAGLQIKDVAEDYGITRTSFSRKLRGSFNDEESAKVISIINNLTK